MPLRASNAVAFVCALWVLLACDRQGSLRVSPTLLESDDYARWDFILSGFPVERLLQLGSDHLLWTASVEIRFGNQMGAVRGVSGNALRVGFVAPPLPGHYQVVLWVDGLDYTAVEAVSVVAPGTVALIPVLPDPCALCPIRDHARTVCIQGKCDWVCEAGYSDCDGDPSNGCETSLKAPARCVR